MLLVLLVCQFVCTVFSVKSENPFYLMSYKNEISNENHKSKWGTIIQMVAIFTISLKCTKIQRTMF